MCEKEESQVLTRPLNQQEAIVIESLYCQNKSTNQVAYEMRITPSRVYQIKLRALAKIRLGNKPLPKPLPITKIKLGELLDER